MNWLDIALLLAAYLLGSIATAIVVSRMLGLPDPRTIGSGNPGATNVLRSGNRKAALATLLGDLSKGLVPVLIARALELSDAAIMLTGLAAIIGHIFPIFFRFKGGKGVATALGVLLGISPLLGLLTLAAWLLVAITLRYSSLAALVASLMAPILTWALGMDLAYIIGVAGMSALLIYRHRANIQRLMSGTESRIGAKKLGSSEQTQPKAES